MSPPNPSYPNYISTDIETARKSNLSFSNCYLRDWSYDEDVDLYSVIERRGVGISWKEVSQELWEERRRRITSDKKSSSRDGKSKSMSVKASRHTSSTVTEDYAAASNHQSNEMIYPPRSEYEVYVRWNRELQPMIVSAAAQLGMGVAPGGD
jgi:hypothetical protein